MEAEAHDETRDVIDELIEQGLARPGVRPPGGFSAIKRVTSTLSTAEIIRDLRGRW